MIFFLLFLILPFLLYNSIIYIVIKKAFRQNNFSYKETGLSIIIAAKNEAENIPLLINALNSLKYNNELYEIIIVDDNSSDNTFEKIKELITDKPNFKLLKAKNKILPGKKGALTVGIENAKNDFILITDGDCIPQKGWLISYAEKFSGGFDVIFGVAPFFREESFINKITRFENLRSSLLTFSAAALKIPYSAAARNFGFRKSSFISIDGYSKTTETLSGDDDLLIREAFKKKLKIGFVTNKESFVYSTSKRMLKDYLSQKARHTQTSLHYLPEHKVMLGIWHSLNMLFLFSPLLIFVNPLFISLFIIKIMTDVIIVLNLQRHLGYNFNPLEIIYHQIIYEIFLIINFFNALKGKIDWKG